MVYSAPTMEIATLLKQEYHARCERNQRYSIRAFAKSFGMSHTIVSLVMNGKRTPTAEFLQKIQGILPAPKNNGRQGATSGLSMSITKDTQLLEVEDFSQIASWLHFAVLSYVRLSDLEFSAKLIAKRMSVPLVQAQNVIKDLEFAGLIKQQKNKHWLRSDKPVMINNTRYEKACTDFIRSYIHKAEKALDHCPFDARDMRSTTFVMNTQDFDYARSRLAAFRRELSDELAQRRSPNTVVALNTQLFSLMNDER